MKLNELKGNNMIQYDLIEKTVIQNVILYNLGNYPDNFDAYQFYQNLKNTDIEICLYDFLDTHDEDISLTEVNEIYLFADIKLFLEEVVDSQIWLIKSSMKECGFL